jgi:hypothetical protein
LAVFGGLFVCKRDASGIILQQPANGLNKHGPVGLVDAMDCGEAVYVGPRIPPLDNH